eukprot:jgi/Mesvir1/10221/Mv08541-RA.1
MAETIQQWELDVLAACLSSEHDISRRILCVIGSTDATFGSAVVHDPVSALVDVREAREWTTGLGQLLKDACRFPRYRKYLFLFRRDGEEVDPSTIRTVRACCAGFDVETFDIMEDLWSPYGSAAYTTPPFVAHMRSLLRLKLHEETDAYDAEVTPSRTFARPPDRRSTSAGRRDGPAMRRASLS